MNYFNPLPTRARRRTFRVKRFTRRVITSVMHVQDYVLDIGFADGVHRQVDFAYIVDEKYKEVALFREVAINASGDYLIWGKMGMVVFGYSIYEQKK